MKLTSKLILRATTFCKSCVKYDVDLKKANNIIQELKAKITRIQAEKLKLSLQLRLRDAFKENGNEKTQQNNVELNEQEQNEDNEKGEEDKGAEKIKAEEEEKKEEEEIKKEVEEPTEEYEILTDEIFVNCTLCNKSLSQSENPNHLCLERECAKCPICSQTFKTTETLLAHLSTHSFGFGLQNGDGKLPHKCDSCHMSYALSILLECHRKSHKINVFSKCNDNFILIC